MLFLFRINDLSRIILLGIILAAIRMPFWISGVPALETVFQFQILSETLSAGRLIYRDIWHNISPFSALILQMIGELFGRSFVAFQMLGFIFILVQALYFNQILNKLDAMKDRTLVPALFYIFFGSLFVEQFSVSPQLLGMFPLLLTFSILMEQIRYGANTEKFFHIGFFFSISTLFFGPFIWLLPFFLIYYPFIFVMDIRRYALFLAGFAFPFISVLFYFFLRNGASQFLDFYVFQLIHPFYNNYFTVVQYVVFLTVPTLLLVLGLFQSFFKSKFLNFQSSYAYLFLIIGVFSIPVIWFTKELSIQSFTFLIPVWVFFASQIYLDIKRRGINEFIFTFLLLLIVFVNFGFTYKKFFNPRAINIDKIELVVSSDIKNSKIMLLENNVGNLFDNKLAGPFMFYPFTERFFMKPISNNDISRIHDQVIDETPDFILDSKSYFQKILNRDLILQSKYKKSNSNTFQKVD